jgi:hypothetical protein
MAHPRLSYINPKAVIPAKAGIQLEKTRFRVKPGMTIKRETYDELHYSLIMI